MYSVGRVAPLHCGLQLRGRDVAVFPWHTDCHVGGCLADPLSDEMITAPTIIPPTIHAVRLPSGVILAQPVPLKTNSASSSKTIHFNKNESFLNFMSLSFTMNNLFARLVHERVLNNWIGLGVLYIEQGLNQH